MKCQICEEAEEEMNYAESVMDFTHGFTKKICKGCYKGILLDKRDNINKTLKELETSQKQRSAK